eukprot:jgi/Chlat1/4764/Chrsp308S00817
MLTGSKGTKYGLQKRGPPRGPGQKKAAALPAAARPSIFGDDEDEAAPEAIEAAIARQAAAVRNRKEVEDRLKDALAQDPTVFDYDGVYDKMKVEAAAPARQEKTVRAPKYIGSLLEKAKEREREHNLAFERKVHREQEKEAHLYGDKDKFVTAAYKRKLAEDQKWIEDERRKELIEQAQDVTKRTDLNDFYRNLWHAQQRQTTPSVAEETQQPSSEKASLPSTLGRAAEASGQSPSTHKRASSPSASPHDEVDKESEEQEKEDKEEKEEKHKGAENIETEQPAQDVKEAAPPKPSKEERAEAARARYLARKKVKPS